MKRIKPLHLLPFVLTLLVATGSAQPEAKPRALVFETADRYTKRIGATRLLRDAGFEVASGDLTATYATIDADVVMLGSFVSEHAGYGAFMKTHAARLRDFVAAGGVVWQWTQADQREASPPFLPDTLSVRRVDTDLDELFVHAPDHPLLADLPIDRTSGPAKLRLPRHLKRPANWESVRDQAGFRILLASTPEGRFPALLVGQHGKGRYTIASLFLDKLDPPKRAPTAPDNATATPKSCRTAARTLTANLRGWVAAVRAGRAAPVEPTPPYRAPKPLPFVDGSWTLVVLPDTQVYVMRHPKTFDRMTDWIAAERERRNIAFVVHVGDLVNNNNAPQWENAQRSMSALDGHVDYAVAPGNHDMGPGGSARTRETMFHRYFPVKSIKERATFGGLFEAGRLDNSWHRFEAGGQKWLVLALEFGPRKPVVRWANRILKKHADHRAILATHAFTYSDDTRYDHRTRPDQHWNPHRYGVAKLDGGVTDGEELWTRLASRHANVRFVLSGHVLNDGLGRLSTLGAHGNRVHQLLANYQNQGRGGDGYLRLMEFLPDRKRVQVKTYSPHLGRYKTDPQNQFVLTLDAPKR